MGHERMVLDRLRERADPLLTVIARRMLSLSPNLLTWLSLAFAVLAGLIFYLSTPANERRYCFLCIASLLVFMNGFTDAIDGKIAKMKKIDSAKGDFLDHAIDRFSDVSMILGISLSEWCDARIGLFSIAGVLLTSYMGTQAQAVGYGRIYRGLLGRADRLFLLMVIPILQHIFLDFEILDLNMMEIMMLYFAIVGFLTAVERFLITLRWFREGDGN